METKSNEETKSTNIFEDINTKIDDNIEKLNKATNDNDLVANVNNAPVGSEEHTEINKHIDNVKEINSTKRVNQTVRILKFIGWIGLILTAITELIGSIYDINYHVPTLYDDIGIFGIGIIGGLVTIISILLAHKMGDGLVNNKWKSTPRWILILFMLVGIGFGLYFNYRMVTNYSKNIIEDLKTQQLNSNNSISGVKNKIADSDIDLKNKKLDRLNEKLDTLNNRIIKINKQKDSYNLTISKAMAMKDGTSNKKEIRKINQNIYTSRKEIKRLDKEIENINAQTIIVENKINDTTNNINKLADSKIDNLKNLNEEMKGEQLNRLVFLFALVSFFKLSSFMSLVADFISNKNTEKEYMDKLDSIRNVTNANSVISSQLMSYEAQQVSAMNKNLSMIRLNNETTHLSSLNNMYQQTNSTKGFISATNELTDTNTELVNMAIDGAKNKILANIENKRRLALEEVLNSDYFKK